MVADRVARHREIQGSRVRMMEAYQFSFRIPVTGFWILLCWRALQNKNRGTLGD